MPLMNVPGWRSGDSLPAEMRSGVKEWQGSGLMPSLRLSAGGAGLSGNSIWYGAHEGPSGFRAYNWPPFGYRGLSALGQEDGVSFCDGINCYDGSGNLIGPDPNATVGTGPPPPPLDTSTLASIPPPDIPPPSVNYSGPVTVKPGQATPQAPPGYQWAKVIGASGNLLAQVLAVSNKQGVQTLPNGAQIVYPGGTISTLASTTGGGVIGQQPGASLNLFTGQTVVLLMGGAFVLLMIFMMQRK